MKKNIFQILVCILLILFVHVPAYASELVEMYPKSGWVYAHVDDYCMASLEYEDFSLLKFYNSQGANSIRIGVEFAKPVLDPEKIYQTDIFVDAVMGIETKGKPKNPYNVVFNIGDKKVLKAMGGAQELSIGLGETLYVFRFSGQVFEQEKLFQCGKEKDSTVKQVFDQLNFLSDDHPKAIDESKGSGFEPDAVVESRVLTDVARKNETELSHKESWAPQLTRSFANVHGVGSSADKELDLENRANEGTEGFSPLTWNRYDRDNVSEKHEFVALGDGYLNTIETAGKGADIHGVNVQNRVTDNDVKPKAYALDEFFGKELRHSASKGKPRSEENGWVQTSLGQGLREVPEVEAVPRVIDINNMDNEDLPSDLKGIQNYLTGNNNENESKELIESLLVQMELLEKEKEALRKRVPEQPTPLSVIRSCTKERDLIVQMQEEVMRVRSEKFDLEKKQEIQSEVLEGCLPAESASELGFEDVPFEYGYDPLDEASDVATGTGDESEAISDSNDISVEKQEAFGPLPEVTDHEVVQEFMDKDEASIEGEFEGNVDPLLREVPENSKIESSSSLSADELSSETGIN